MPINLAWRTVALPSLGGTMTSMCSELLCLQLFLLKEDLSIDCVRAAGCGIRVGGGWGSGLGLTSSSSAYVRLSSCNTRDP